MKKWLMLSIVGLFALVAVPDSVRADEPFMFRLSPDGDGGFKVLAGVDLISLMPSERSAREQRRDERRARRANMTRTEIVGDHFRERWGWYAAGAGLLATDRVAHNNDWLWYDWFGGSGSGRSTDTVTGDQIGDRMSINIVGDDNRVTLNNRSDLSTTAPSATAGE